MSALIIFCTAIGSFSAGIAAGALWCLRGPDPSDPYNKPGDSQ